MNKQGVRAVAVLVCVFVLGALTGVFVDRHHLLAPQGMSTAEMVHNEAMGELREVLDLDDRQMEQIHAVLARHQEEVQKAWEALRPEVQTAMQGVHVEIAALLRPEQRALYHDWLTERQRESHGEDSAGLPRH